MRQQPIAAWGAWERLHLAGRQIPAIYSAAEATSGPMAVNGIWHSTPATDES
jgi:hypothetical protein